MQLGMTKSQVNMVKGLAACPGGCIVVVGPTGCGKTTTIFNFLHMVDYELRSVLSVEDPVEYQIPFANQQQVNEKAGVTFEALLKTAVRQDPDVLFIGEIRDQHSAKIAMDFASTGHLTVTSLHTSNATTAIARLERVGISRDAMSESIIGVIAQRLVKRLCEHCREVVPISEEEIRMLSAFSDQIPTQVAHPCGCPACNNTGYYGCEGVFEILEFDGAISEMIRSGMAISEIRYYARNRGDYLISNHVIEKVRDLICAPEDAYEKVLVEEIKLKGLQPGNAPTDVPVPSTGQVSAGTNNRAGSISTDKDGASILIVEDDEDTQKLIARILQDEGYSVGVASDGIDAMMILSKDPYDLVISDIEMPNMDGFQLVQVMQQKGIELPLLFLTCREDLEDEERGLAFGAVDYVRKPIKKEVLLLRIKSALRRFGFGTESVKNVGELQKVASTIGNEEAVDVS